MDRYTSQEACEKHMSWTPVLEFLEMCKAQPDLMSAAPEIWHSEEAASFIRPELGNQKDSLILLAKVSYKPGKIGEALEGWKPVVKHGQSNEPGVLTYAVAKGVEHEDRLTFVEVYENEKYLHEVHMQSPALQQKIKEDESLRVADPDVVFLKHVAGYWYK